MKKKFLLVLSMLAFVVCLFAISVSAAKTAVVDGIYYTLDGSGESAYATVNEENRTKCEKETVKIPATITVDDVTYKVTAIANNAFGIVDGNPNAFIKHLEIGANVAKVGEHAFRRITSLQTVVINNTEAATGIDFYNGQFKDCTNLVSVDAKNAKIVAYGDYCFWNCPNLVSVDYPSMLTKIGVSCFRDCVNFTNGDLFNTQVATISAWAFGSCKSITEFKFPSTLKSIGNNVFLYCPVETYVFPHNVNSIGADTLAHQSVIKTLIMPAISEGHSINSGFLFSTRPRVVIYAGDNVDYFKSQFSSLSGYTVKKFEEYDPAVAYTTNTIFYGAGKTCATCNGLLGEKGFIFEDLLTAMKDGQECTHCGKGNYSATYAPVFVDLGYSKFELNGKCSIMQGFKIDYDSVNVYNENVAGGDIGAFGVLAVADRRVEDVAFDGNGVALDGVLSYEVKTGHNYFEIKIVNIPANEKLDEETYYADAKFHLCAYVNIGDKVYYVSEDYVGTVLGDAVSYNEIVVK